MSGQRINESISRTVDEIYLDQLVEESRVKRCEADKLSKAKCIN